jgi:dihydrofolate reductase
MGRFYIPDPPGTVRRPACRFPVGPFVVIMNGASRGAANANQEIVMSTFRVSNFTVSIDGYGAGPDQSEATPLGAGGEALHEWMVTTRTFKAMYGQEGGTAGVDDQITARGMANVGAWIMGRNMFGPVRGPWPNDDWRGWWGTDPPYHCDVFVLTHHARAPVTMEGGTTFHFVTDGIHAALERARAAAGDKDIRLGGGASVIQQYLRAGLLDELHLAIAPVVLGRGESLFAGLDLLALGYAVTEGVTTEKALHVVLKKRR